MPRAPRVAGGAGVGRAGDKPAQLTAAAVATASLGGAPLAARGDDGALFRGQRARACRTRLSATSPSCRFASSAGTPSAQKTGLLPEHGAAPAVTENTVQRVELAAQKPSAQRKGRLGGHPERARVVSAVAPRRRAKAPLWLPFAFAEADVQGLFTASEPRARKHVLSWHASSPTVSQLFSGGHWPMLRTHWQFQQATWDVGQAPHVALHAELHDPSVQRCGFSKGQPFAALHCNVRQAREQSVQADHARHLGVRARTEAVEAADGQEDGALQLVAVVLAARHNSGSHGRIWPTRPSGGRAYRRRHDPSRQRTASLGQSMVDDELSTRAHCGCALSLRPAAHCSARQSTHIGPCGDALSGGALDGARLILALGAHLAVVVVLHALAVAAEVRRGHGAIGRHGAVLRTVTAVRTERRKR
jgi:hypothetical protein